MLAEIAADKIVSMIITIDGPAASGKSTVSRRVSDVLGFLHLDTGSMYRALTWKALKDHVDLKDSRKLVRLAKGADISFKPQKNGSKVLIILDGKDITDEIRKPEVSQNVSTVSSYPMVRKEMVKKQRQIAKGKNVVAEGRDCGTIVFPQAEIKIYLEATVGERAIRRSKELKEKGLSIDLNKLKRDIILRDNKDSSRKTSPLMKAPDARVIDTTMMTIEEVVREIISQLKKE